MSQEAGSTERRAPPPREMVWDLFQVLFQPSAPGLQGRRVGLVVGCGVRAAVQPSFSPRFLTYTWAPPVPPHSPWYRGAQSSQEVSSAHREPRRPRAKCMGWVDRNGPGTVDHSEPSYRDDPCVGPWCVTRYHGDTLYSCSLYFRPGPQNTSRSGPLPSTLTNHLSPGSPHDIFSMGKPQGH